ncbi:hypothetical protein KBD20_04700 [Candidatus Saccharibacteria bacterium]|nr:hypothetical protein [Candidatus Saccharibacteria bacterium]
MAVGAQSYRPDAAKQAAAREQIASHRDIDLPELITFLDPDLVAYIDDYQTGIIDLRGCELPSDIDSNLATSLQNNTSTYDDETEDMLASDPVYARLLKQPAGEERSSAIRTRRSVIVLSLLVLANAVSPDEPKQESDQVA